jgi:hypothetical protein
VDKIRDLLEYYAAYGGNCLPIFGDNQEDLDFFTLQDGADRLYRNVGTELSLYNEKYLRRAQISALCFSVTASVYVIKFRLVWNIPVNFGRTLRKLRRKLLCSSSGFYASNIL